MGPAPLIFRLDDSPSEWSSRKDLPQG